MKNSLLRNDLLYIGEHLTCNHYMADIGTGWLYREIDADEQIMYQSLQNNHLVFFMEGHYCPVKAGKSVFEIVET